MREELITFETAILAKEKGFDVPVKFGVYGVKMKLTEFHNKGRVECVNWNAKEKQQTHSKATSIPTQSLLQKWLREKHEIVVTPYANASGYCVELHYSPKKGGTHIKDFSFLEETNSGCFETYEQALEKGLQEALKLIE